MMTSVQSGRSDTAPVARAVEPVRLLVDGHVHVHPLFDEGRFLAAAYENLSRHGTGLPTLLLAELADANVFLRWRSGHAPWPVALTSETVSIVLNGRLLVVAGRQIVTREHVEVLALCCVAEFQDNRPFIETVERVVGAGALCVLPWGVGKWTGNRAKLIRAVLDSPLASAVCLGDNGNRLAGTPVPRLLRAGAERNMPIIAGSDPLPLRGHETRVGSYGNAIEGRFDPDAPASGFFATLRNAPGDIEPFGGLTGFPRFVRSQFAMQRRKLK
jgi:hypothetical protein